MISLHRRILLIASLAAVIVCVTSLADAAKIPSPAKTTTPDAAVKSEDPLLSQVEEAIAISARRYLQADVHTPWQIMHGLLALRNDYLIKKGDEKIAAIDWISQGQSYKGDSWFERTPYGGRAHPYNKDYIFEGHPDQFLAIFTMSNLPLTHTFKTRRGTITIADMVKHAQAKANTSDEVTWSLWALSHYLEPDAEWKNNRGEHWSIERMVRIQTRAAVTTAACGGTHGLFALSYARNRYLETNQHPRGVWIEADQKIKRYIREAREYQNSDGTFSSNYFKGRGRTSKLETIIGTSGHILEFLMAALPDRRLDEEWVRNGVRAIATTLIDNRKEALECGAMYHAIDGLAIYRDRKKPQIEIAAPSDTESDAKPSTGNSDVSIEAPKPVPVRSAKNVAK